VSYSCRKKRNASSSFKCGNKQKLKEGNELRGLLTTLMMIMSSRGEGLKILGRWELRSK
jgi:hypothetical protein